MEFGSTTAPPESTTTETFYQYLQIFQDYIIIVLYDPIDFVQKVNAKRNFKIGLSMQLLIADERKNKIK